MNLAADEIHVWLAFDGELRDSPRLGEYEAMLEPAERERRQRLMGDHLRHQFLITRALQRTVLAEYLPGAAPEDLRFCVGAKGKPTLAGEHAALNLHFNIAHTQGLVALAASRETHVGVDVENVAARTAPLAIANRFFSVEEAQALSALPPAEQSQRFYALWTLKESWLKATGLGIAAGLGNVAFEFGAGHRPTSVSIVNDDARQWAFWQTRPGAEHVLALAMRRATAGHTRVQMWSCVPGWPATRHALPAPVLLGEPAG